LAQTTKITSYKDEEGQTWKKSKTGFTFSALTNLLLLAGEAAAEGLPVAYQQKP